MNAKTVADETAIPPEPGTGKRFVFVLRNILYVRNFEWPIRAMAKAGHHITVILGDRNETSVDAEQQVERLQRDLGDRISVESTAAKLGRQRRLVTDIQSARDILFYTGEHYEQAAFARERIVVKATPVARFLFARELFRSPRISTRTKAFLKSLYDAVPADEAITRKLRALNPDVLIISPLIDIRTLQLYWVKAAKNLRIRTVLSVASWDNLTNKSCIQDMPDKVLVWNEVQKEEATRLHGVPAGDVIVTGAQLYDHWFNRAPSMSYADFCARFSFDPDALLFLYTGSSVSIARDESGFVKEWLARLRSNSDPRLKNANVLIRPHPLNQAGLVAADFSAYGKVAVHPKSGGFPVTESAQNEYFDALYHCAAVIGINTSAIVEAAILDKQSFTIETPEFQNTQSGTLHFFHLTGSGILRQSASFDAHIAELVQALDSSSENKKARDQFVESFLRPHGRERAATPIFVSQLEAIAQAPAPANPSARPSLPIRLCLALLSAASELAYKSKRLFRR